jgi:hypothetical protein
LEKLKIFISKYYFNLIIGVVVLFAFIVRYYHTSIGLPYLYYWDEPQTASTALYMMKSGDFNPHFFAYGTLMIYANLIVDILHYFSLMGLPSTDPNYLTTLSDIQINVDTGWKWSISHPSFYHANRVFSVLLSTGTVVVTYLIGKIVFNRYIALISATFLATLYFHVLRSAWIATDSPVAFFVLLVVLFSLLFIETQKLSYFILSLLFVGVSIATKYNAGLSILIPFISLIWLSYSAKGSVKSYMWFLSLSLPIVIFVMIMPYAILDLPTFLRHIGGEIRHYKVLGQGVDNSVEIGLPHLKLQLLNFYHNIGFFNTIMALLGVFGILFRPLFIFTLMMPLLYISYMIGTKVSYHRNFVQVYPFIALLFGSGFYMLYIAIDRFRREYNLVSPIVVTLLALLLLAPQAYSTLKLSKIEKDARDSRTHAINAINRLKGYDRVVIAKELRIHPTELKILQIPYTVEPLLTIASKPLEEKILYVIPALVTSAKWREKKEIVGAMRSFIDSIPTSAIVQKIVRNDRGDRRAYVGVTRLEYYSISPTILFIKK